MAAERPSILGDPGTTWTNDGPKVKWQLIVTFQNSCARCIQYDHRISNWWGIPFHVGCVCTQIPVLPGAESEPFTDYRAEVGKLDEAQRKRVMGVSNLRLVEAGLAKWDDVVQRSRILDFHEVIDRLNLKKSDLARIGVPKRSIDEAFATLRTPERVAKDLRQADLIARAKALGATDAEIRAGASPIIAARVGIRPGYNPRGGLPGGPNPPPPPPAPAPRPVHPRPPVAPVAANAPLPKVEPPVRVVGDSRVTQGDKSYTVQTSQLNAERWAREKYARWGDGLSDGERKAIKATASGHEIDDALRRGEIRDAAVKQVVKLIDAAIGRAKLPEAIAVYRAVEPAVAGVERQATAIPVGTTILDPTYPTFALTEATAIEDIEEGGFLVEYLAARGSPLGSLDAVGADDRGVMIAPRDSVFRVVGTRTRPGKPDIVSVVVDAK